MTLETLVTRAQAGDKHALEELIAQIQDNVYYLSLRMLANPADAKDACQEILVRVITKLSTFKAKSSFTTWVYRLAVNHLLNTTQALQKNNALTFDMFREDLEVDLQPPDAFSSRPDYKLMVDEVRVACTMAMLLCLDPKHRAAYILGVIFEYDSVEAGAIQNITPANHRQRLGRAKAKVEDFTKDTCGVVSTSARCSCPNKLTGAVRRGRIGLQTRPAKQNGRAYEAALEMIQAIEETKRGHALQLQIERPSAPTGSSPHIEAMLELATSALPN